MTPTGIPSPSLCPGSACPSTAGSCPGAGSGDVRRGLAFAFAPNFSAITPEVVLAAIGQAFYATGVGMAMMLAYGAYVPTRRRFARAVRHPPPQGAPHPR